MERLSEFRARTGTARSNAREAERARQVALRERVVALAIQPLSDGHVDRVAAYREVLGDGRSLRTVDIACDHCGTQMCLEIGARYMSNPPKDRVVCVGCGEGAYVPEESL